LSGIQIDKQPPGPIIMLKRDLIPGRQNQATGRSAQRAAATAIRKTPYRRSVLKQIVPSGYHRQQRFIASAGSPVSAGSS
jgi:hypothetical protein